MAPAAPSANYSMAMAKDRVNNSKVKNLLYGSSSERPETPKHEGKRRVAHQAGHGTPYATYDGAPAAQGDFVAKPSKLKDGADKIGASPLAYAVPTQPTHYAVQDDHADHGKRGTRKEGAGKVTTGGFDPSVYAQNRATAAANMANMKARNWGSANLLGQQQATATGAARVPGLHPEDEDEQPPQQYASPYAPYAPYAGH